MIDKIKLTNIEFYVISLLLMYIPFQIFINLYFHLGHAFYYVDEILIAFITAFVFMGIAFSGRVKNYVIVYASILLSFILLTVLSCLFNQSSLRIVDIGNYVKSFVPVLLFSTIFTRLDPVQLKRLWMRVRMVGLIIASLGIVQEMVFLLNGQFILSLQHNWSLRYGLVRITSIMEQPNDFGLYMLIMFILEFFSNKKKLNISSFLFMTAIILSFSRIVWLSLIIILILSSLSGLKMKRSIVPIAAGLVIFLYPLMQKVSGEITRIYVLRTAVQIAETNPLGIGVGMYNGNFQQLINFSSDKVNYKSIADKTVLYRHSYIDLFWAQILGEVGVAGVFLFCVILILPALFLNRIALSSEDPFVNQFSTGLKYLMCVMVPLYLTGNTLNITPVILTLTILAGATIGTYKKRKIVSMTGF